MHIFIYPSQDTYINNSDKYQNKNFGLDEVLEIYASNSGKTTVYTDPNWHTPPLTASSYGNNGWLAYTTSSLFIYSGSKWYAYSLTSSVIPNTSFIANFTGRLSNVTTAPRNIPLDDAAIFGCAVMTGAGAVIKAAFIAAVPRHCERDFNQATGAVYSPTALHRQCFLERWAVVAAVAVLGVSDAVFMNRVLDHRHGLISFGMGMYVQLSSWLPERETQGVRSPQVWPGRRSKRRHC